MPFCALASPVNASACPDGGNRTKSLDTYMFKLSPSWPVSLLLYFVGALSVSLPAEPPFPTLFAFGPLGRAVEKLKSYRLLGRLRVWLIS